MESPTAQLHIGIVACSAGGAALCYRTICHEGARQLGPYEHPQLSMHSHALAAYLRCIDADDWDGVGELMLSPAHKLAAAGADFLICPYNTIDQALPGILARSPLPWLHIADVVAGEALARGYRRVGLTGTRWLVESEVYPERFGARGLATVRPGLAARMKDGGCDAVLLGCTEIPLIMNNSNSPLPTLDSTRLLARAALRHAIGQS